MEYVLLRSSVIGKLNETNRGMLKELKLAEDEGLRVNDLASPLEKSKVHISDQVSKLEDYGLVEKRVSDEGKQRVFLGEDIWFLSESDLPR